MGAGTGGGKLVAGMGDVMGTVCGRLKLRSPNDNKSTSAGPFVSVAAFKGLSGG